MRQNKKIKSLIFFLAGIILAAWLIFVLNNPPRPTTSSSKFLVAASFYPLYFFSEQIGGNKAEAINLTPAGAEPHDYEPTAQEAASIEDSKMLILNGEGLEAWGESIRQNLDPQKTIIVTIGEGLANRQLAEGGKNTIDPHVWLSPPLAEKMADRIAQGFIQVDPINKGYYLANADKLKMQLSDLDNEYKQGLSHCQEKNIITSHAAFGYLAAAYGLKQVPITGLSPDAEPSPRQLAEIVKFARDNKVKYIFFESLASPKLAQTIATEVGARTLVLNSLEGLSRDELAQGKNYFTVMQSNLINLKIALSCQ